MKKPQENIERSGNNISIEKVDILSDTKKDIEEILLSIKDNHHDILIIGNGEIGDKAKAFLEKTDKIHEVGFKTTKKIILCSDVIARCMEDKRGDENYENSFLKKLVRSINTYYKKDSPLLIVRSSGQGDATGVGIYESDFVENNVNLTTAIRNVYESNFTNSAKEYRKKLGIENDGMGIIIEPCIGETYKSKRDNEYDRSEMEFFGPQLSGWYQKQESGTAEIGINGGLGGGVESRNFDKFKSKSEVGSNLGQVMPNKYFEGEYLRIERQLDELRRFGIRIPKKTKEEFLQEIGVNPQEFSNKGESVSLKLKKNILSTISMFRLEYHPKKNFNDVEIPEYIKNNIFKYPLGEFIESVKSLEGNIGASQYLEWAAKLNEKGNFDTYITQIADQIKDTFSINFNRESMCILDFNLVVNHSGIKENIQDIIFIPSFPTYNDERLYNEEESERLKRSGISLNEFMRELNKKNKNYLLIICDDNTLGGGSLDFDCFSNAAGIIEYRLHGSGHESTPASHYEGLLSSTNILFSYIWEGMEINDMLVKLFGHGKIYSNKREVKTFKIPDNKTITWVQDAKKGIGKLFLEDKEIPPKV